MVNCESFRAVVKFEEDWRLKCCSFEWPMNVSQSISQHVSVGVLFLYCLILLQALNCCPQEDAKRYNRNSFVLSRPSSVNLFFFLSCFCIWLAFFLLFGSMVIINQMICIFPVLSSAFVVFFVLCLSCVLCIFHYNHLFLCLLFFVVIRPPWVPQWPQTNKFHSSFDSDKNIFLIHLNDKSNEQPK